MCPTIIISWSQAYKMAFHGHTIRHLCLNETFQWRWLFVFQTAESAEWEGEGVPGSAQELIPEETGTDRCTEKRSHHWRYCCLFYHTDTLVLAPDEVDNVFSHELWTFSGESVSVVGLSHMEKTAGDPLCQMHSHLWFSRVVAPGESVKEAG